MDSSPADTTGIGAIFDAGRGGGIAPGAPPAVAIGGGVAVLFALFLVTREGFTRAVSQATVLTSR